MRVVGGAGERGSGGAEVQGVQGGKGDTESNRGCRLTD